MLKKNPDPIQAMLVVLLSPLCTSLWWMLAAKNKIAGSGSAKAQGLKCKAGICAGGLERLPWLGLGPCTGSIKPPTGKDECHSEFPSDWRNGRFHSVETDAE